MKLKRSAITGNVTRKRNSHVATGTVLRAGEDAQVTQTTDASLNGFIVMEKMTAEMGQMSCQRTVLSVKKREITNVETKDVYPKDGSVILKMTVETILMKTMKCVPEDTENVQSQSLDVGMTNVYLLGGDVITMMTVVMAVTKQTA